MYAVAVHTFAGGMAMGVRERFEIKRAYEPLDFGTRTLEERLGLTVHARGNHDITKWAVPKRSVDFVFGNPRCGGFSALGSNVSVQGHSAGAGCRQSVDAEQLCRFGVRLKAPVIAFESVQNILAPKNRDFIDRMIDDVFEPHGYRIAHVLHNAATLGSTQVRRRYFCVAYKKGLIFNAIPKPGARARTVGDVLRRFEGRRVKAVNLNTNRDVPYTENTRYLLKDDIEKMIPYLEQGDCTNNLHFRYGPAFFRAIGSERLTRQSENARSVIPFGTMMRNNCPGRLKWDGPCPTLCGDCQNLIHPREDRSLSIGELCGLMGWPEGLIPAGPQPAAQIAKGIVPACGAWLAEMVEACLDEQWDEDITLTWDHIRGEMREESTRGHYEKTIQLTNMIPKKTATVMNNTKDEVHESLPLGLKDPKEPKRLKVRRRCGR